MHDVRPFIRLPFEEPGELLYVGYRPDAHSWLDELIETGNEVDVLEVWPANCTFGHPGARRFWVQDVREGPPASYDYVWWWHGPEHLHRGEFPVVLGKLLARTRRLLACAAPWGRYDQGAHQGNEKERHLWSVREEDFTEAGLKVRTDGEMDQAGSEIVGWVET